MATASKSIQSPKLSTTGGSSSEGTSLHSDFTRLGSGPSMPADFTDLLSYIQISLPSELCQDMSLEDAIKIVQELLKENKTLRETVQSSNLLMRNQCEYLDQLKEKQRIEHATIREKYQSTKAYVLDLQGRYNGVSAELQNVNEQLREYKRNDGSSKQSYVENLGQIKELETKNEQLMADKRQDKQDYAQLNCELHEAKLALKEMEVKVMMMEQNVKDVTCQLEDKEMKFKDAIELLKAEKVDLLAENTELLTQNNDDYVVITDSSVHFLPSAAGGGSRSATAEKSARDESSVQPGSKQEQAISDLLIELQQKVKIISELQEVNKNQEVSINRLQSELNQREHDLTQKTENQTVSQKQIQQNYEGKIQQMAIQLDRAKKELQQAKEHTAAGQAEAGHELRAQVMSLVKELQDTQKREEQAIEIVKHQKQRCQDVETRMNTLQAEQVRDRQIIKTLQTAGQDWERMIAKERQEKEISKQQQAELRKNFDELCTDYHDLLRTYEDFRTHHESCPSETTIDRDSQEKVDNLMAQLVTADETVQHQSDRNEDLKCRLQAYEEKVEVLRAQAQVYKMDFEAERESRSKLHSEKTKAEEQASELRLQYQILRQEMESSANQQLGDMRRRHNVNPGAGGVGAMVMNVGGAGMNMTVVRDPGFNYNAYDKAPASQDQMRGHNARGDQDRLMQYECPICQCLQPDEDSLAIHVQECAAQTIH